MCLRNSPNTIAELRPFERLSRIRLSSSSRFSNFSLLILLAGSLLVLQNCENPGSVGRSFGPENPQLKRDTIPVPSISITQLKAYSGNLSFISAGIYDHALFGRYEALGLMQPTLISRNDSIGPNATFVMKLFIDGITGDTTSTSTFELLEVTRRWRAQAWTLDSLPLTDLAVLHTFTVTNEDSVVFNLPAGWYNRYLDRKNDSSSSRDSTFLNTIFGFAVRGVNTDKIIAMDALTSAIFVEQNDTTLTRRAITFRQTANSLQRTPSAALLPNDVTIVENNFNTVGILDIDFSEEFIGARFPSRVELVMYVDTLTMQSHLPVGHAWFDPAQVPIYVLEEYETDFAIFNNPNLFVNRSDGGTFRSNLTTYYNSVITTDQNLGDLYFLSNRYNGAVSPKLFFNHLSADRKPVLITTTFTNPFEEN